MAGAAGTALRGGAVAAARVESPVTGAVRAVTTDPDPADGTAPPRAGPTPRPAGRRDLHRPVRSAPSAGAVALALHVTERPGSPAVGPGAAAATGAISAAGVGLAVAAPLPLAPSAMKPSAPPTPTTAGIAAIPSAFAARITAVARSPTGGEPATG